MVYGILVFSDLRFHDSLISVSTSMKVLMIGDVVAKPGRLAVLERLQDLREQNQIDLAVMNAENVAGGFSITPSLADQLFEAGIDVMTSGNHIFDKREAIEYIAKHLPMILFASPSRCWSRCWPRRKCVLSICMPKPLPKRWRWDGFLMAGFPQSSARTHMCKLPMREFCRRARLI
jgi:hypothetical protein